MAEGPGVASHLDATAGVASTASHSDAGLVLQMSSADGTQARTSEAGQRQVMGEGEHGQGKDKLWARVSTGRAKTSYGRG
eukprot:360672-Chlamydomonas_euryale.AAC.20